MTKIKLDQNEIFIKVESAENFGKDFVKKQYDIWVTTKTQEQHHEDYTRIRKWICVVLIAIIILLGVVVYFYFDEYWDKVILSFIAGLVGLFARNLRFMSGIIKEQQNKKLWFSYSAYFLFILASSLLIFGIISLYFSTSNLFYFFLLPLNFYIGLLTYFIFTLIEKILSIKVGN